MLCLKAEAPGYEMYGSHGGGLSMNLRTIKGYLQKVGRGSRLSNSSSLSNGSVSSFGLEDVRTSDYEKGRERCDKIFLYRFQLEQDVQRLQKELQEELDLHVALAKAVGEITAPLSNFPRHLPNEAQELLANIVMLETTVSKLEEELVTLHFQLTQERNERRLAEYHLRQFPSVSEMSCSPVDRNEQTSQQYVGDTQEIMMVTPLLHQTGMEDLNKVSSPENLWHCPNQLSEEMVRCMKNIFISLTDSSATISSKLSSSGFTSSPVSPHGHLSGYSLTSFSDSSTIPALMQSSSVELQSSFQILRPETTDPYRVHGKLSWTNIGRYMSAIEVSWMSVGKNQLEYAAETLRRFRFLVEQLAMVNPAHMTRNERLAFWINLYNALIMHAYLAYGVPRSEMKLFSLMQKVAYTVGGHSFSAVDIEYILLRMKSPAHRPQIALVLAIQKFKISEVHGKYGIDKAEPLVAFALSCGMYSSPAVRIFTAANVNEELHDSMRDYIQASVGLSDKGKLLVPKLLHCFAKGMVEDSLLTDWICQFLSPQQASMVRDCTSQRRQRFLGARSCGIVPFVSRFRYLFLPENRSSLFTLMKI